MFNWLREFYEIRRENKLAIQCASCEVLKVELAAERREKQMLLSRILNPQEQVQTLNEIGDPKPILPRHKPWKVVQQELESKDRQEHARIMNEFKAKTGLKTENVPGVNIPSETTARLEKEMGISDAG